MQMAFDCIFGQENDAALTSRRFSTSRVLPCGQWLGKLYALHSIEIENAKIYPMDSIKIY